MAARIGLERPMGPGGGDPVRGGPPARLQSTVSTETGVLHARVLELGPELVDRVLDELDAAAAFEPAVMHVDLPLGDPRCAIAIECASEFGAAVRDAVLAERHRVSR